MRFVLFLLALAAPVCAHADPAPAATGKKEAGGAGRCAPPLETSGQAICAARHYLESKSEACTGAVRFEYVAALKAGYWVVRVTPKGDLTTCSVDELEIEKASGHLLRWATAKRQPAPSS